MSNVIATYSTLGSALQMCHGTLFTLELIIHVAGPVTRFHECYDLCGLNECKMQAARYARGLA